MTSLTPLTPLTPQTGRPNGRHGEVNTTTERNSVKNGHDYSVVPNSPDKDSPVDASKKIARTPTIY
jgi:hypothetical protein